MKPHATILDALWGLLLGGALTGAFLAWFAVLPSIGLLWLLGWLG